MLTIKEPLEPLHKVKSFAAAVGYDVNYLYGLIRQGRIRVVRLPGKKRTSIRIPHAEYLRLRGEL